MPKFTNQDFLSILDIGIAVAGEKDRNKLLDMIIDKGMELTNCDAGTLYILKDQKLHFKIMKTISQGVDKGRNGEVMEIPAPQNTPSEVPLIAQTEDPSIAIKEQKRKEEEEKARQEEI